MYAKLQWPIILVWTTFIPGINHRILAIKTRDSLAPVKYWWTADKKQAMKLSTGTDILITDVGLQQ